MQYGNASWGFRETPLEQQLKITSEMGLELLELGIANGENDLSLDITDKEICKVKNLYDKYNVKLLCAATGNDFTAGNNSDVTKVKKVTDICAKLGVKYLRIFAGFSPVDEVVGERWKMMIDSLNEVYEYAEKKGVILTVETHGGVNGYDDGVEHFYSTSSKPDVLLKMISEIPQIRLNFDPANIYAVGIERPETVYEMIKDKVSCIHLKDFVKLSSGHIRPSVCGESDMDWASMLNSLSDFEGPALFEYENTEDIKDGLLKCYKYILSKKERM